MSTITIPLTKLRPNLPKMLDKISKFFDRCIITRYGEPQAVILSDKDYESLLETLDILSDQKLLKELRDAERALAKGKGVPWEKAKAKLGHA